MAIPTAAARRRLGHPDRGGTPPAMEYWYRLAKGTSVREESFGLLFYTRTGPRLYFLPSGKLLRCDFFQSDMTLAQWLQTMPDPVSSVRARSLSAALGELKNKGVIVEF
ncbi:MAG: mycofactocin biosynthesis chaperone MftB [Syntrophobacteraceae bacterium]|nr:mycofactocin biosynthesis chaperone MftB [Syntrophobacteraceae bacterium]